MSASEFKIEHFVCEDTQPPSETVRVHGKLVGEHIEQLSKLLDECFRGPRVEFTLDLEDVQYYNSTALGAVIRAYTVAKRCDKSLQVRGSGAVERLMGRIRDDDDDDDWTSGKRAKLDPPDVPLSDANAKEFGGDSP